MIKLFLEKNFFFFFVVTANDWAEDESVLSGVGGRCSRLDEEEEDTAGGALPACCCLTLGLRLLMRLPGDTLLFFALPVLVLTGGTVTIESFISSLESSGMTKGSSRTMLRLFARA